MIHTTLLLPDGSLIQEEADLTQRWRDNPGSYCWVDLADEDPEAERELLTALGCHSLAIQDAQRHRHPPKLEVFDDHLFILYRGLTDIQEGLNLQQLPIALFVSDSLLITRHNGASVAISQWWQDRSTHQYLQTPLLLAIKIMHTSFGRYLDAVLDFEENLGDKEEIIQTAGDDNDLRELTGFKARLRKLRRVFNYHERLTANLLALAREDDSGEHYAPFLHHLQDLHERSDRIASLMGMYYEICGDLIEGYLSITSHRLNRTIQFLTIITTIFVPLSFLAGVYGMNFENMPELQREYGYYILLGVMATIASGALVIFKLKRWL